MSVTATSFFSFSSLAGNARLGGTPLEPASFARSLPLLEGRRRLARLRSAYRGRFSFVLADGGGSRCEGEGEEEEAFSTCLRGEVVVPFLGRGSWAEGGEAREMLVFELEGGRSSASSSESDVEVSEDKDSGSGPRVAFSHASLLIVRRSFGRGDGIAGSFGLVVSSAAPCCPRGVLSSLSSSRDIVSSPSNLWLPSFLYSSAYQDF